MKIRNTKKNDTATKHKHKNEQKNTDSNNKNYQVTFKHNKNNIKHAKKKS